MQRALRGIDEPCGGCPAVEDSLLVLQCKSNNCLHYLCSSENARQKCCRCQYTVSRQNLWPIAWYTFLKHLQWCPVEAFGPHFLLCWAREKDNFSVNSTFDSSDQLLSCSHSRCQYIVQFAQIDAWCLFPTCDASSLKNEAGWYFMCWKCWKSLHSLEEGTTEV